MSSTNKTNYYKLSQYIGTDKPTYLGDYNSDMTKIDTAIHGVEDKATSASQDAGSAIARVTQLETTVQTQTDSITTLQTDTSALKTQVKTAQESATQANQTATNAQNSANSALLTANNASAKADNVNKDVALWTGSLRNGNITLNDSLNNYRFLYVKTSAGGISGLIPYRFDETVYTTAQQIRASEGASVHTIGIELKVTDDTHLTVNTMMMSHTFQSTHPALDATTLLGVYGIPR